jgi:hypothetical protein
MKYAITLAAAAAALASSVVSAHAGCGAPSNQTAAAAHEIPGFIVEAMKPTISRRPAVADAAHEIVGTWLVTYTSGGKPFGKALIQWHDDGTEWENINLPLAGGNICVGSWRAVDTTHVTRKHVGWLYNSGNLVGYFLEMETDAVANPNRYTGVNDTKIFDLKGNVLAEVPGTSFANKIGP